MRRARREPTGLFGLFGARQSHPNAGQSYALNPVKLLRARVRGETNDRSNEAIFQSPRKSTATGIDHD
jgi:hypothetical protein